MMQKPIGEHFVKCYVKIKMHQACGICQVSLAGRCLLAWYAFLWALAPSPSSRMWS